MSLCDLVLFIAPPNQHAVTLMRGLASIHISQTKAQNACPRRKHIKIEKTQDVSSFQIIGDKQYLRIYN